MRYFPGPTFGPVTYTISQAVYEPLPFIIYHNGHTVGRVAEMAVVKRFMREYALLCIENYNPVLYRQLRELTDPELETVLRDERGVEKFQEKP